MMYKIMKPPIIPNIGALVAKKESGSDKAEANNLLLLVLDGTVKLIDCSESKNIYISLFSPEALPWKRIN